MAVGKTLEVSGADRTEPAAREEEGQWDGSDTLLRSRFLALLSCRTLTCRGALFTQLMLRRLSISLSYLTQLPFKTLTHIFF